MLIITNKHAGVSGDDRSMLQYKIEIQHLLCTKITGETFTNDIVQQLVVK